MKFFEFIFIALIVIGLILWTIAKLNPSALPPTSMSNNTSTLKLTSSAFADGGMIPKKYTCDGDRALSPPLSIGGVPEGAGFLVLVMDDSDVPKQLRPDGVFDHWVLYGIPPETKQIQEGGLAGNPGLNGAGNAAYTGPCPPTNYEPSTHRYVFTLYAVSGTLNFIKVPSKADVLGAIQGRVLAKTTLTGLYSRK
jgi:Raf kinase inhibitor-like YbhB/YbcL family protein